LNFFITEDDMCTTQKLNLARVQKWIEANGSTVVESLELADKVLCMTCNGWSLLEEASYDRIKSLSTDHSDKMIVMGCVNDAQASKVKKIWNGPTVKTAGDKPYSFAEIESFFPEFTVKLKDVPAQSVFRRKEDYRDYNLSKRFINISEGCAFDCSFCTHKPGLGQRRSRPIDEILQQIDECVEEKVRIINLMAMETSLYGIDVGTNYPKLLKAVLERHDSYEVHVAQFQPDGINRYYDELLPLFKNKRVSDIQTPIQTTSARLMKMMKRGEYSKKVGSFMKDVRKINPRAILRTDLIIGWPTETSEERLATLDFAGQHFDEIALYSVELSAARPAWQYKDDAFSEEDLAEIRRSSVKYIKLKYPDVVVHSGQQDDATVKSAEEQRMHLRKSREVLV
jgi:tRNA A37 methylthiotransferase MiaB